MNRVPDPIGQMLAGLTAEERDALLARLLRERIEKQLNDEDAFCVKDGEEELAVVLPRVKPGPPLDENDPNFWAEMERRASTPGVVLSADEFLRLQRERANRDRI